jgi:hypothetical protein
MYVSLLFFLFAVISCNQNNNLPNNKVVTGMIDSENTEVSGDDGYGVSEPNGGTEGTFGVDIGATQSSGGGRNNENQDRRYQVDSPIITDSTQVDEEGGRTIFILEKNSKLIDCGDNSNEIKDFNLLVVALFFLFISIFLLKISSESWLKYEWYRNEDFLKDKRIEYDNEIQQLIKMNDLRDHPELRPKEYFENLNNEIQKIQSKKDDFLSTETFPEFSFEQISKKNLLIASLSILFFIAYLNVLSANNYELNLNNYYNPLNLLFLKNKIFTFPLLIIASYFSVISLFRFTLIQGSNSTNPKNKFSFFGLVVSFITLSGAIITITKFIIG